MSTAEAVSLLHGVMAIDIFPGHKLTLPPDAITGAGYIPGIARLGIPSLRESDASLGVAFALGMRHDGATALPSSLAAAASFSPELAFAGGAMIAREALAKGFNVLLAGGVDLARDPRGGRNFEYVGEDPLLAGMIAGAAIRGIQSEHVISTAKHFALNDLETGRTFHDAVIAEPAARESDLLAFEIALEQGRPGAVMCAYNRVNGPYACESPWLLNDVLKRDWNFPGWVMSDWGAVHAITALDAGLDQESGEQLDKKVWFGDALLKKAEADPATRARVRQAAGRIVASMKQVGIMGERRATAPDMAADAEIAQRQEEAGIVLLQNTGAILPLSMKTRRIAVIGGHADAGGLTGGGSSQVVGPGGPAASIPITSEGIAGSGWNTEIFDGAPPLAAIREAVPQASVTFTTSRYPAEAAEAARHADVAIVFATQWNIEGADLPDLGLPDGQDAVIAAVAAANPHSVVVLETGNPVLMPWRSSVAGIVEAWYPGARGGNAIARVLFGAVNPSGRLPISFPRTLSQLPRPANPGLGQPGGTAFPVIYSEGSDVGYRWYAARHATPLFPFGFGLGYTNFSIGDLKVVPGKNPSFSFRLTNTGTRPGTDTPQIYLLGAPDRTQLRLLGWARAALRPGETRELQVIADPRLLASWNQARHGWSIEPGIYRFAVGESAAALSLGADAVLPAQFLAP